MRVYLLHLFCILFLSHSLHAQVPIDNNAQAYIFQAHIHSDIEKSAINHFVRALKYYGIWDNIHALYIPTGGTELSHKLNLKDPRDADDAFRLYYPNGAIHTKAGTDWNGINQGALTFYTPTSTRLHLMVYQDEEANESFLFSGDRNGVTDLGSYAWSALYTNGYLGFGNQGNADYGPEAVKKGFFYAQRFSNDSTEAYVNGRKEFSWLQPFSPYYNTDTSQKLWINKNGGDSTFLGTARYQVISIGNAMSSEFVETYYTCVQAFLSELGIQVGEPTDYPAVPVNYSTVPSQVYRWVKAAENAVDTAIDGVHLFYLNDSLYLWGGWNGNWYPFDYNSGYVSGDGGATWTKIGYAPWNIRHSAAYGVSSGRTAFLVGSDMMPATTDQDRKEVWKTKNGRDWKRVKNRAPWRGDLVLHGMAIKKDTLYIAGGEFRSLTYGGTISAGVNDTIWRSSDAGLRWEPINTTAGFLGGILYNNFKYFKAGKKFVALCGGRYDDNPANRTFSSQIWTSPDAIHWTREPDAPFAARQYSDMVEWDGKLWVWAGARPSSGGSGSLNLKDLWYMDKYGQWHEVGSIPVPGRHASGIAVDAKHNRLVIACGNMHTDVWTLEKVTVIPALSISCDREVILDSNCAVTVPNLVDSPQTAYIPLATFSQSPAAGTLISSGHDMTHLVTITATDSLGNNYLHSILLTAVDTLSPEFIPPVDTMVALDQNCSITVPDLISGLQGHDNCGQVSFTQFPAPNSVLGSAHQQTTSICITANDGNGNITEKRVVISAVDTTRPEIFLPPSQSIALDENSFITIPDMIAQAAVHDHCGHPTLTQSPAIGARVALQHGQAVAVQLIADDGNGNQSQGIVTLTAVDTTAPVISLVTEIELVAKKGTCSSDSSIVLPTITDNCQVQSIEGTRSDNLQLDDPYPVGTTTISWSAVDEAGNVTLRKQQVIVKDLELPVISTFADTSICFQAVASDYSIPVPIVSDNCGIQSVSYTISGATTRSGETANASGSLNEGVTIIKWTATDIHGNSTTTEARVTIAKPLVMTVPDVYAVTSGADPNKLYIGYGPKSITLNAEVNGGIAPYMFRWSTSDSTASISFNPPMPGTFDLSVKVTDALGCTKISEKQIKVIDVRCGIRMEKIILCENSNNKYVTQCVTADEVMPLLEKGAYLGMCSDVQFSSSTRTPINPAIDSVHAIFLKVVPNPSCNYFTLYINSDQPSKKAAIKIYNALGALVDTKAGVTAGQPVQFGATYSSGTYVVEVTQEEKRSYIMVIKT